MQAHNVNMWYDGLAFETTGAACTLIITDKEIARGATGLVRVGVMRSGAGEEVRVACKVCVPCAPRAFLLQTVISGSVLYILVLADAAHAV